MQLVIGNKNYSSWSMRAWLLLRAAGIAFEEIRLRMDQFAGDPGAAATDSAFARRMAGLSPAGRVPVLVDDAGQPVWDTLAIAETVAERHPGHPGLWPQDAHARARARSLCAEMHAGFGALRQHCTMNIEFVRPEMGPELLAAHPALARDLQRIDAMWCDALTRSGGPFLFGDWSIADAFYAPVVSRVRSYGLPLSAPAADYAARVWAHPAVQDWVAEALAEHDFLAGEEIYRRQRD
jgi:glutathione S-transferase